MTRDVLLAHVDHTLQPQTRSHRGRCHTMLTGAGLGDDARLAHPAGQHGLPDGVVHFVGARVVEVFALKKHAGTAEFARQPFGKIQRCGPPDVVGQIGIQLGLERRVGLEPIIGRDQGIQRLDQGFGHKGPAVRTEMARRGIRWSTSDWIGRHVELLSQKLACGRLI